MKEFYDFPKGFYLEYDLDSSECNRQMTVLVDLKTDGLREYFYFFRDKNNAPRITVCIAFDDAGNSYRGVSICGAKDFVTRLIGKYIAKRRMLRAYKLKDRIDYARPNVIESENAEEATDFFYLVDRENEKIENQKWIYNPELSEYEQNLKGAVKYVRDTTETEEHCTGSSECDTKHI